MQRLSGNGCRSLQCRVRERRHLRSRTSHCISWSVPGLCCNQLLHGVVLKPYCLTHLRQVGAMCQSHS